MAPRRKTRRVSATWDGSSTPARSPRHVVEGPGAGFPLEHLLRLGMEPGHHLAGYQGNGQHDGEGHQVLGILHGEGQVGRHKEEIEQGDAQEGRQQGRPLAQAQGQQKHHQQEQHERCWPWSSQAVRGLATRTARPQAAAARGVAPERVGERG
jgi:hypothetical protein